MNIFYYSLHQVLEYDEIRILQSAGHNIFCLGCNTKDQAVGDFRPAFALNEQERTLYAEYERSGGKYLHWSASDDELLPPGFLERFSVVIVMHSVDFIARHWNKIKHATVVWRTIGQSIDFCETQIAPFRAQGVKIVRYSPSEQAAAGYVGHDACIRFSKDEDVFKDWKPQTDRFLTFSNRLQQRYPLSALAFRAFAQQLPIDLGGIENDTFQQSLGLVDWANQLELYRTSRAYFYFTGWDVPYTLTFMEAWMVGIPIFAYLPRLRRDKFLEIHTLIEDGVDGFICDTFPQVIDRAYQLMNDGGLGETIGRRGRASAIRLFGKKTIGAQWKSFLSQFE